MLKITPPEKPRNSGVSEQQRFTLSVDCLNKLLKISKNSGMSRSNVIEELIMGYDLGVAKDEAQTEQPKEKKIVNAKPVVCVFDLFKRGHSFMQIAALTKLPYSEIAKIIGLKVDYHNAVFVDNNM